MYAIMEQIEIIEKLVILSGDTYVNDVTDSLYKFHAGTTEATKDMKIASGGEGSPGVLSSGTGKYIVPDAQFLMKWLFTKWIWRASTSGERISTGPNWKNAASKIATWKGLSSAEPASAILI